MNSIVNRLNTATKFLVDKMPFDVGGFVLGTEAPGVIFVYMYSRYRELPSISRSIAESEFKEGKAEFLKIVDEAQLFKEFIKDKRLEFSLLYDTGPGGGALPLVIEKDGALEFRLIEE